MLSFKIPQNVQVEDKIVSFLTVRQLIICAVGGGLAYIFYITLAPIYYAEVWAPPVVITTLITAAVAFVKINDISFTKWVLLFIEFVVNPKMRVWDKTANSDLLFGFVASGQAKSAPAKSKTELQPQEKNFQSLNKIARELDANPFAAEASQFEQQDQRLQKSQEERLEQSIAQNVALAKAQKESQAAAPENPAPANLQQAAPVPPPAVPKQKPAPPQAAPPPAVVQRDKRSLPMPKIDVQKLQSENAQTQNQPNPAPAQNQPKKFRPVRPVKQVDTTQPPQVPDSHLQILQSSQESEIPVNFQKEQ